MKILKAVLGWSNPETAGGSHHRLYALDKGSNPRWDGGGRTVERAIVGLNMGQGHEGDRYLIVHLGNRFVNEERVDRIVVGIQKVLEEEKNEKTD